MNNNKIFNLVSLFVLSYSKIALLINDSDLNPNLRKLMNKAFIKNSLPEVIQYQEIISKYRFSEDGIDALFDENNSFLGSVEVSFDVLASVKLDKLGNSAAVLSLTFNF